MQTCTVEVALGGNILNTVIKKNVTPPEVVLLRAIHGHDAVTLVGDVDEGKHVHREEAERLQFAYQGRASLRFGEDPRPVWSVCFPGSHPKLPIRFSEIGFGNFAGDDDGEEEEREAEAPKRGRGRPRKADAPSDTTDQEPDQE